jgi:hypothetical protein
MGRRVGQDVAQYDKHGFFIDMQLAARYPRSWLMKEI